MTWEAFRHHTFNGTYWALRRRSDAANAYAGDVPGYELMLTRALTPRRFKSQAAAQQAADVANGLAPEVPLSASQRGYLASFLDDFRRSVGEKLLTFDKEAFIARVAQAEIEDGPVTASTLNTAKRLRTRGYFELFRHRGTRDLFWLTLQFSAKGAEALYRLRPA